MTDLDQPTAGVREQLGAQADVQLHLTTAAVLWDVIV
ncbi:hypothetical protein SAMN04490220_1573 [Rhodococcus jostii]|uniref:Uncharacterized protein n=1 Tax=Rhodococcus jostii TaxID=132919 RepID=A0A1H4SB39_RHOJO|nr:hypothetical protein SAMN04490220_1573 [Rhodococcus jostii]